MIMEKNVFKCGPNAEDRYENYSWEDKVGCRSHWINGNGSIINCNASNNFSRYRDNYIIGNGITELCDACFSKSSVIQVSLPSTLLVIGNRCFYNSRVTEIRLPDGLEEIGHNNFPTTLQSLRIPQKIKEFFIDNVVDCRDLLEITVDENNEFYKSKNGVLYNHDMTEILFCPNLKEGKVIIPNTVTRIGEYCFANCKNLDLIIIPSTVIEIGDYAFKNIEIKKLRIPNSVKSIGRGCFSGASISEEFKFSNQIASLPNETFSYFACKPQLNFLSRLEYIGEDSFERSPGATLPSTISLLKIKEIQSCAFQETPVNTIELFSSLEKMGKTVFDQTNNNFVLRYFSYMPMLIDDNSFGNLGNEATLVVPRGTKMIFEGASPWNSFPIIEEWDLNVDKNENGEFVAVNDEIHCKRLVSLIESKNKVERQYLSEIINELAQDYLYVDTDEEFKDAKVLMAYNRSFSPAIVPELEKQLCANWAIKYKLKIIDEMIYSNQFPPLMFAGQSESKSLPKNEIVELPVPEISMIECKQETIQTQISVYFDNDILKQLQDLLVSAKQSVKIAVSWFTNHSLYEQVKQMAVDGIKVQLIINNDLINNGGYCLNFNELIEKGVEISLVEYPHLLHHKFVIIDDSLLVTGSYNWTRFSAKNYENIVIISDDMIVDQYANEFNKMLENAEYKRIYKVPEQVKERSEYDRSSFKQYITEELDAKAKDCSDERDKITALHKAAQLNPVYLEKINPGVQEKYVDAFKALESKASIQNIIIDSVSQTQKVANKSKPQKTSSSSESASPTKPLSKATNKQVLSKTQEAVLEKVKASGLVMVLDVSGSMRDTFSKGHAHEIAKKALAASLTLTDANEVNVWTFGNNASFVGHYGIDQIDKINKISCKGEGTELWRFVDKADDSISDGALCLILTDDDSSSISGAIEKMKQRNKVFWQIIAYENDVKSIKASIKDVNNASVLTLTDYQKRTDEEIYKLLLKDYIIWKSRN